MIALRAIRTGDLIRVDPYQYTARLSSPGALHPNTAYVFHAATYPTNADIVGYAEPEGFGRFLSWGNIVAWKPQPVSKS